MAESSFFWSGTTPGDAGPYSDEDFRDYMKYMFSARNGFGLLTDDGPILSSGDGSNPPLWVEAQSPVAAGVRVAIGRAMIQGVYYKNTAFHNLSISGNVSGNPRIDRIVLQIDFTAQTCRLVVLEGTPAGSPSAPALTQTSSIWEYSLATVAVAASFVTIAQSDITNSYPEGITPVGSMMAYIGTVAPTGWLLCDGSAVDRITYGPLFTLLGTTYGVGDGSTTFNLPDFRGRVPVGLDNMGGSSANRVTAVEADSLNSTGGGEENHTLTVNEMPSHRHIVNNSSDTRASGGSNTGPGSNGSTNSSYQGGDAAHNNMQPWLPVAWIIKF